MKIAVIGAGALGTFYGAMIAAYNEDTTLVCRERDVETLKKGITVTGDIEKSAHPHISSKPPRADVVFITVKAYDVASAAGSLSLDPGALVIVIHNGLGSDEVAASILGRGHVGVGVSYSGVTFLAPGKVKLNGYTETVLGSIEPEVHKRMGEALRILERAGLKARIADDIRAAQWEKMYANVGINAITAITGLTNGMPLEVPELKETVEAAVTEAGQVSRAMGIKTHVDPVDNTLKVIRDTYNNRSSMLQDVSKGKRTEIDALNGKISELGRKAGIPTPVNDTITGLVKGIEKR
ncbi:MAG TPA: ketopantoate reductase family protein, partial [Methanocellaceae archaeon]